MNNQSYHTDRMNEYPDTLLTTAELGEADVPVTPLPNPGEGGPVDSGGNQNNGANVPVIPLPNPGEGGPVDSGNRPGFPPIFRPIFPGNSGSVTVIPGVTFPCYNCTATSFGRVRILNASTGYQPFYVYLGNWMVASGLGNGDITGYVQSASGTQTVTVSGANGYVYIQKTVQVRASASSIPSAAPVTPTARPVTRQITMVSTNTPVMLMYPCRTGSSVCAAAALIPPAPSPASFENTPREIPYRKAGGSREIPAPTAPPDTARKENASRTIASSVRGSSPACRPITIPAPPR